MDNPDSTSTMSDNEHQSGKVEQDDELAPPKPKEETTTPPVEQAIAADRNTADTLTTPSNDDSAKPNADGVEVKTEESEVLEESPDKAGSDPSPDGNNDVSNKSSEETSAASASNEEGEVSSSAESGTAADDTAMKTEPNSNSTPSVAATEPEPSENEEKADSEASEPAVKEEIKEEEEEGTEMDVESTEATNDPEPQTAAESPTVKTETSTNSNSVINNNSTTASYSTRGRSTNAEAMDDATYGTRQRSASTEATEDTTYSTRHRSTSTEATELTQERAHVRDVFEELPRLKDPPSGSFLVEGTEEERRTRTRYIPEVEGMHMLWKHEISRDIALARSLPSTINQAGFVITRNRRLAEGAGNFNNSMDVDGEENDIAINDENAKTIKLPYSTLTIPSDAFVAPRGSEVGETEDSIVVKPEPAVPSPSVVESVTSFNPPRPPESVGGKKRHRMIRWERRPEDIEVDMKNYRKTVQRTRQELQKCETEFERLEMVDAHLRRHFLNHSGLLDQEYKKLNDEMEGEVEKLMKESELIGSRTRSRNLTKVDVVMRDVLTMFRNEQKDGPMNGFTTSVEPASSGLFPGFGGLNAEAFTDWERSTKLKSMKPAVSWIEPGQKVKTMYGEGTVVEVIPPASPPNDNAANIANESKKNDTKKTKYDYSLPLRVKIRLGYGVGVFAASSILEIESPAHFTDAKLAKRWKGMINSALKVGPCIDLQGMLPNSEHNSNGETNHVSEMDIDSGNPDGVSNKEFLPVGATLIPTKGGRGNFLHNMEIHDIEEALKNTLYDGHGVLGRKSNPGVTEDIRKWEDEEQEYLNLRASILQLKNTLHRQRRIRVLNEKTRASMDDRYLRAEELVSEMRSDLKSLKRRLGDELSELGITDEMAEQILFQFYQGHRDEDKGDASTPKRLRRASSMIGEILPDIDMALHPRERDPRDSMDDQGTDDLSGDDLETQRPTKKIRSGE
mmetsp:Transcript_27582/g.60723  ORF Transcript_27582/g.60723 Transcript_27582/m.60723 type:complete len:964 (-) Transcript_27582:209-3100(-)